MENNAESMLAELQEKQAALLAEIEALRADLERYKSECQRYRNECRSALGAARNAAALAELTEQKRAWITDGVPAPAFFEVHEAGENAYLIYRDNADAAEFDDYCTALEGAGFSLHTTHAEGTARYAFYYNDRAVVNVSFSTHDSILRAVVEPAADTALVPLSVIADGVKGCTAPAFVQMNDHLNDDVDCGMSYIFRLADGSFILIDGGWDTAAIADALYEKLTVMSEGREIVISAWFFTHAHVDHIGAVYKMAQKYGDSITVKRVIYNFPGESRMTEMGDEFVRRYVRRWHEMLKDFGEVEIIKARTGQRYLFDGLTLDMLFTYEDYKMPRPLRSFNDTSLVFRVTAEGQTYMFLGDASVDMCGILVAKYGEGMVSDIVQVAHHGYGGGTKEVYDAIRAPIVLWPVPFDHPRTGVPRYSNPEWSPITREMIRNYATAVYPQCEGTRTWLLPLGEPEELKAK